MSQNDIERAVALIRNNSVTFKTKGTNFIYSIKGNRMVLKIDHAHAIGMYTLSMDGKALVRVRQHSTKPQDARAIAALEMLERMAISRLEFSPQFIPRHHRTR